MDRPEITQPSSTGRIGRWVGTLVAVTLGAAWLNRRKRAARR